MSPPQVHPKSLLQFSLRLPQFPSNLPQVCLSLPADYLVSYPVGYFIGHLMGYLGDYLSGCSSGYLAALHPQRFHLNAYQPNVQPNV